VGLPGGVSGRVANALRGLGRTPDPRVWAGSHLDSVPSGSKFDGALGVVSAIEAVERIGSGAVVAFREEETDCTGSRVFVEARDLPIVELYSGAGHDAPILAGAGVPTAMFFVRSLNGGISHSPDELSSAEDVALAVDLLAGAFERLALRRD
jgi:acetylornithine deacetylase/succinyl-diaminopimelate desuccinylase-like protein